MIEAVGNLWDEPADCRVVTINGIVKKDGTNVMGRGTALQAKNKFPGIDAYIGYIIQQRGNKFMVVGPSFLSGFLGGAMGDEPLVDYYLGFLPVKHHWKEKADITLINSSIDTMLHYAKMFKFSRIVLPRPGCGNGKLDWETEVKPLLEQKLDDRFVVINDKP